jgi:hypothetical protein
MGFLSAGNNTVNTLAVLIFFARLGDIGSTYLATPTLRMESNPLMRFGGWKLAILTVFACLIPYYDAQLGLTMLVLSLLVTGSNLSKGWLMRALGETDYQVMIRSAARRSTLPAALAFVLGGAASVGLAGAVMMFVAGGSDTWGYWAASGVTLYALAIGFYGALSAIMLYRQIAAAPVVTGE